MSINIPNTPVSLLKKLTKKNATAPQWDRFATLYTPVIRAWLKCKQIPEADLDDVQQIVFVKLLHLLREKPYDEARGKFRKYLYSIINSTAIDHFRKRLARQNHLQNGDQELIESHPDDHAPIPFQVDMQFQLARMHAAIEVIRRDPKLSPIYRKVLEECVINGEHPINLVKSTRFSYQHLYRIQKEIYKLIKKRMELWEI